MTDDAVREHYRVLLQLVIEKNPQFIEAIRRNPMMEDVLMEIVKDRVDEKVNAKEQQTTVTHINDIMTKLKYTAEQAMELAGLWKDHGNELTVEETVRDMRKGRSFDHRYRCFDMVSQRKSISHRFYCGCNAFFDFYCNLYGTGAGNA